MNTLNNQSNPYDEDEISLKDIIEFFVTSWKTILSFGLAGLVSALIFIFTVTPQYEGVAQVQMSQLAPKGNVNPSGTNIEDPALLMARFKLPSTYTENEIKACGLEGKVGAKETLANSMVKISQPKGLNIIEVKIQQSSPALVQSCIETIVERIRVTQRAIKEPFLEEARQKIALYEKQLQSTQDILARADRSGNALSATYLSARDEARVLRDEIIDLHDFIASGEIRKAKLISPIYVADRPVFPKKRISVVIGLIAGLFLGILFVAGRRFVRSQLM